MNIESPKEMSSMQSYVNEAWGVIAHTGIDMEGMTVDHIGIRVSWGEKGEGDYSNYLLSKSYIEETGAILILEAIIPMTNEGRPIAIYRLSEPIETQGGKVVYLEIPAPRRGKTEVTKLDHIEIVLKDGETLASFIEKHRNILEQFTSEDLDEIALKEPNSFNPDVTLTFADGIVVKFHKEDIGKIVTREKEEPAIKAIQAALVKAFEENNPGVLNF